MRPGGLVLLFFALLCLGACVNDRPARDVQRNELAYSTMQQAQNTLSQQSYRLAPYDVVNVTVFNEPQLSLTNAEVDSEGYLSMPLLGQIRVAGQTTSQLSASIANRLTPAYVRDPRVTVTVNSTEARKITVEGEVKMPGVYTIGGQSSLLQAVAMAQGETQISKLSQCIVFRTVNGQRMAALFDLHAIRAGRAPDPPIIGRDVIIVGQSQARRLWQDLLQAMPFFNLYRAY